MKKSIYLSGIFAMSLAMVSCSLDVENPSAMEGEVIFSSPVQANDAVMGLHQSFAETNSYRGRFIPYYGINSDCEMYNNTGDVKIDRKNDKEASLACYSAQTSNTYMNTNNNAWAKLYEGIERANKSIKDIKQYGNFTDGTTYAATGRTIGETMHHLYGELLTLRAMVYFDLVKAWGDVPYRFNTVEEDGQYLHRTDLGIVLAKLLDDLKEAEGELFPVGIGYAKSTERVSVAFARGLRARVALMLAGQSIDQNGVTMRDNNVYRDAADAEAKGVKTYTKEELYKIAYDECVAVITENGASLPSDFSKNFRKLCQEDVTATIKNGGESIFEIPFSDGRGRVLYTWGGKHSATSAYTGLAQGGKNGPTPTLWYEYEKDDSRRNITCIPFQWVADESGAKDASGYNVVVKTIGNLTGGGWYFGKLRFEWMNRRVISTNDDGINWQVMRLADVYMMAGEAAYFLGDMQNAKKYIEPVVNRGSATRAAEFAAISVINPSSYKNDKFFQKFICQERKLEFAGEAIRKQDLIRWGILSEAVKDEAAKMKALANREDYTSALDGTVYEYSAYPKRIYYNKQGLDAIGLEDYYVYGLEKGETDAEGHNMKSSLKIVDTESYLFCNVNTEDDTKTRKAEDINKTSNYFNEYTINDPNGHMFWPIWDYYINGSNGYLVNYYGYK